MAHKRKHTKAGVQYWIGYCRKSTDVEDKQIHSLQDQERMITQCYDRFPLTERNGRPLRLFQEARSAYHPGRPVFDAIMRMADGDEVYGLIVVHPNRVSRNHADSGAFVQRLVEGRIRCLATTSGQRYTASDSNAIFMLTLENAMSWKDSRDKGERILQAMRLRAAEGKPMGRLRAGYQTVYQPDGTKTIEIEETAAPIIRQLFQLAATGTSSLRVLTEEARQMGLRNRSGKPFVCSAIHAMLRDPLYKGYVRFDGIVARGTHAPLVSEVLWQRTQDALSSRFTAASRPKDIGLRQLFVFGNLLRCPRCGRTLCPYRAKGKYVYYECKNPTSRCRVCVPQRVLVQQLPLLLSQIVLGEEDLARLRQSLLREHAARGQDESSHRRRLNDEYDKVQREIADVFAQRRDAEALGIWDAVAMRLTRLTQRRDELQGMLSAVHDKSNAWIDTVIRSFELLKLLQEAIFHGSARSRELVLKALASNYTVEGKTLVPELRTPFRQASKRRDCPEWYTELDDARTEVIETFERLQAALSLFSACT